MIDSLSGGTGPRIALENLDLYLTYPLVICDAWQRRSPVPSAERGRHCCWSCRTRQQQLMFIGTQIMYPHLLVSTGSFIREVTMAGIRFGPAQGSEGKIVKRKSQKLMCQTS